MSQTLVPTALVLTVSDLSEQLRTSDIYTLRRIVPADRGQDWGSPGQDAQPMGKS